jgi:two-component sensor histidine kinase/putative methionine-R-sulfoxide reductase with GAF domain
VETLDTSSRDELIDDLQRLVRELKDANARLRGQSSQRLEARVAELVALQKIYSAANSSLNLEQILSLTTETVSEVLKAEFCSIFLVEGRDNLVLRATKGLNPEAVGRVIMHVGEGITGTAAKEGRSIALREPWEDPRFCYVPFLWEERCQSLLSVPIILYTPRKLIGVLNIQTLLPRDFIGREISFVEMVAGHLAIAIENARLYQQTQDRLHQRLEELVTLHRVSSLIASTLDVSEVLDIIVSQAVVLSHTDFAIMFQLAEDGKTIWVPATYGLTSERVANWRVSTQTSELGRAIAAGRSLVISDLESDPQVLAVAPMAAEGEYRSLALVPLMTRKRTVGGLAVCGRSPHDFSDDETRLLSIFADQAAIAIENARLYEESQRNLAIQTTLLTEMHHRVKNNLQTVAALLSLQARRAQSWEMAAPLRESCARIESIAAVHELLSRHQIGHVNVEDVAKGVMDVAVMSPVRPGIRVKMQIDCGDVVLGSRHATVLALILNELFANAVSHGFADRQEGTITVRAYTSGDDTIITVHDDGTGLPDGFSVERDMGLGLQIVSTLVETDLQGRFDITNDRGTLATVSFRQ